MEDFKKIQSLLTQPQDVVLFSHRNPDGDALGSTLAMKLYLESRYHNVKIIFPSDYPATFAWMPQIQSSLIFDSTPEECKRAIERSTLIFFLDFGSIDRIDKIGEFVTKKSCPKIMIDHHIDPEPIADFIISETSASSTCEMVFDFIVELSGIKSVSIPIAECIYTGIVTDTGSFKYASSSALFRKVAQLLDIGIDDTHLQNLIHNCLEDKYLKLLGFCLHERLEILSEYRTAIIALSRDDYMKFDIQRGDTEGIVNYLLMLKNVDIAALITEQPSIVKLSLRSKGDISVQEICRDHFKGGGHKNASGGALYGSLASVVKKFKDVLPNYQKVNLTK